MEKIHSTVATAERQEYVPVSFYRAGAAENVRGALLMSRITQEPAVAAASPAIELSIKISIPVAAAAMIAAAIKAFLLPFQ